MAKVWFAGAGPGDPELITIKAQKLIQQADAVLVADSRLVEVVKDWAKPESEIAAAENLTVVQITDWLRDKAQGEASVVYLQADEPGLYGTLIEMLQPLEAAGIAVGVVPGVSSAMALAATVCESLILPNVTQTVIFSRLTENSPMPKGESLPELAQHQCSLCLSSSMALLETIQEALLGAAWEDDTAVLVMGKTCDSTAEKIIRGTLTNIKEKCAAAQISGQVMIIVSPALGAREWFAK